MHWSLIAAQRTGPDVVSVLADQASASSNGTVRFRPRQRVDLVPHALGGTTIAVVGKHPVDRRPNLLGCHGHGLELEPTPSATHRRALYG